MVGNMNYLDYTQEFNGIFTSLLTVIDASLGNFNIHMFDGAPDNYKLLGHAYIVTLVVCFNILLFNLIIAILANTYNIFDSRSNGLYLSKILASRDELVYEENYGAFLCSIPPLNAF
jgi:hypothetical protein